MVTNHILCIHCPHNEPSNIYVLSIFFGHYSNIPFPLSSQSQIRSLDRGQDTQLQAVQSWALVEIVVIKVGLSYI